jgi:hypothetical protein
MGVGQSEISLIEVDSRLVKGCPGFEKADLIFCNGQSGIATPELLSASFLLGGFLLSSLPRASDIEHYAQDNYENYNQTGGFTFVHHYTSLYK